MLRSELGKDVVIAEKAHGLEGRAGTEQDSSGDVCLQGGDWELCLCVVSVMGLKYD